MYPKRNPLCNHDKDDLDEDDYSQHTETLPSGSKVKVTRYKDGSATTHFGGPVGDVNTDEFGEEC
jgi:hypothetical protein